MQKTKTMKIALVALACIAVITTTAFAGLLMTKQVGTWMRVKPAVSMGVFDVDAVTPLTSITLGDFLWFSGKIFPGGLTVVNPEPLPSQRYFINNTDQMDLYVGINFTDLDPGIKFTIRIRRLDQTAWTWLAPYSGYQYIYNLPLISSVNNPDPNVRAAEWYLRVWVDNPSFATYTPTITWSAFDSPSG